MKRKISCFDIWFHVKNFENDGRTPFTFFHTYRNRRDIVISLPGTEVQFLN